jgi:cytochrome c oxidase subunit 2
MKKLSTSYATLGVLAALLFTSGCNKASASEDGKSNEEQLYQLCAQCHGPDGMGKPEIGAPSIAGLPSWYVETQLHKFEQGLRGTHFDDIAGMRMRPMALALAGGEDMKRVAAHVAGLQKKKSAPTVTGGNPEHGKQLYATCVACHGPSGKGSDAVKSPPLAGLQDWYLLGQLEHFRKGVRGADPKDETGTQMKPYAEDLADEQAMKDVVSYIATLPWY